MKKYIVVKTNLMRKQKFYKRDKMVDSWSIRKEDAVKYTFRRKAEQIVNAKTKTLGGSWKDLIRYEVEEVDA